MSKRSRNIRPVGRSPAYPPSAVAVLLLRRTGRTGRLGEVRSRLCCALLATGFTLVFAAASHSASRTINIVITSLSKTAGEMRGSETYTIVEHKKLSVLKSAGEPVLADCLLSSWQTRKLLAESGLTVRKVNTIITGERCELTWQADFGTLPKSFGPLSSMSLKPSSERNREYEFSATLSCPTEDATTPGDLPTGQAGSPLEDFTIMVNVRFPGTVHNNVTPTNRGRIDHTGESIRWKTDAASLKSKTLSLTATVTPGRASEQRYWLVLMVAFTVVIVIVMISVLRRGARNRKQKDS